MYRPRRSNYSVCPTPPFVTFNGEANDPFRGDQPRASAPLGLDLSLPHRLP
jgi:hypothetical protein